MKVQDSTIGTIENNTIDIIEAIKSKRNNVPLSSGTIQAIISDFVTGKIPDYQMSAWLSTVACKDMNMNELESLTRAYVSGGSILDHSTLGKKVVDKHSTGGVGDKVTFIAVPMVAACGIPVSKISGRGLGHAGGTLDKHESIKGLKVDLSADEFNKIIRETGMVMAGQSGDLVPGDKATYQLRDISGSVESIPLIAASIISKKVATGANCLVLDVKTGAGALIQDFEKANELTETMVELARRFNISCRAIISDMSQPLGFAVGNSIEIKEAIEVLKGANIPGLTELSTEIARLMLQTAIPELTDQEARTKVKKTISSGKAFIKFLDWVEAQGGRKEDILNESGLPSAKHKTSIKAVRSGYIESIEPRAIGKASLLLGANRDNKGSVMDHSVGVIIRKHVAEQVKAGEEIAEIHHNDIQISKAKNMIETAYTIVSNPTFAPQIIHKII